MARMSIDDKIELQKQAVSRAKDRYDASVAELEKLMTKRDEIRKKALIAAVTASSKSFGEIMAFLQEDNSEK